jgi:hypothetical protein
MCQATWGMHRVRRALLALALAMLAMALAGCGAASTRSEFAGPDWSRGELIGQAGINNCPAIVWQPESKSTLVAWLAQVEGQWRLQCVRIGPRGENGGVQTLSLALRQPSYPRLARDQRGGYHLFWLDSEAGGSPGLYHTLLSPMGEPQTAPQRVSQAQSDVSGYSFSETEPGVLDVFWSSGPTPRLFHARMQASGELLLAPHPLPAEGAHPAAAVDHQGILHLTWHRALAPGGDEILYATFDPQTLTLSAPSLIATAPTGVGLVLFPPEIGLDLQRVYIFWSQERRGGGRTPGSATTGFQTFPIGHPEAHQGASLEIPSELRPQYQVTTGAFNYTSLAYLEEPAQMSGIEKEVERARNPPHQFEPLTVRVGVEDTYMPYVLPDQREELGVVLSCLMATPKRPGEGTVQIVFFVMKDGLWRGMEVAGITRSASLRPVAVVDDQGAVHLAWLDTGGFGLYDVYYASTATSVREAVNRITAADVLASLAGGTWSAAAALSLFPILVLWLFAPAIWLFVFSVARPDSDLRTRTGWVGLVVAVLLYVVSKVLLVPSFLGYAPFLDIVPPRFTNWILYGLPVLLAAIGLAAMGVYARRSDRKLVLAAFALFAATDSILSLMLYVPNVIGG